MPASPDDLVTEPGTAQELPHNAANGGIWRVRRDGADAVLAQVTRWAREVLD